MIPDTKNGPRKLTGAKAMAGFAFVLSLLMASDALAQQTTVYGPDDQPVGQVQDLLAHNNRQSGIAHDLRRQRTRHRPHVNRQSRHHDDL